MKEQMPVMESLEGRLLLSVDVNPGMSISVINSALANPDPVTNIAAGEYDFGIGEFLDIPSGETVNILSGSNTLFKATTSENEKIFRINGPNTTFNGNGLTISGAHTIGTITGSGFYNNVNISGITSSVNGEGVHYVWEDRKGTLPALEPSVNFSNIVLSGGSTGFHFQPGRTPPDVTSPYISLNHVSADGLSTYLVDLFVIDDGLGERPIGGESISNSALVNSTATFSEAAQTYFDEGGGSVQIFPSALTSDPLEHYPSYIAQENVSVPYVNSVKNSFVTSDMKLISGTFIPQPDSPLNLGGGQYIGANKPAIPGDVTLDGSVDQADYTVWYNNYGTNGAWQQGDVNSDGIIDQADYTVWYNNYGTSGATGQVYTPAQSVSSLSAALPNKVAGVVASEPARNYVASSSQYQNPISASYNAKLEVNGVSPSVNAVPARKVSPVSFRNFPEKNDGLVDVLDLVSLK